MTIMVKIASKEWLDKVKDVYPSVVDKMYANATLTLEMESEIASPASINLMRKQLNRIGIIAPNNLEFFTYDGCYYSTIMTAEFEAQNLAHHFDMEEILNFIEEGG